MLVEKELRRKFKNGFIFCCFMGDLWAQGTPDKVIEDILTVIRNSPGAMFLMLTKNTRRYFDFMDIMPSNVVLGATIETDRYPKPGLSKAPSPLARALNMWQLRQKYPAIKTMVCVEPIMDFDLWYLFAMIMGSRPEYVYIGYDNHKKHLVEPRLAKTKKLIHLLERDTKVLTKTLREPWELVGAR